MLVVLEEPAETGSTFVGDGGKTKLHCHEGFCSPHPPPPPDPRYWPGRECFFKLGHEWDPKFAGCQPESFWDMPPELVRERKAKGELKNIVIRAYTKKDEAWQREHGGAEMAKAFELWDQVPAPQNVAAAQAQHAKAMELWKHQAGAPMVPALQAAFGEERGRSLYNVYAQGHDLPLLEPKAEGALGRVSRWVTDNVPGGWWTVGGAAGVVAYLLLVPPRPKPAKPKPAKAV